MRRSRWEAQVNAVAFLEQLATVLPKGKGGKVKPDEFLKIAGQAWQ